MAKTLVVHGHGKWHPKDDGFFSLPKGVSVDFYSEGGKSLWSGFTYEYLTGSSRALTGGAPDSTITEYRSTPNYTLSELSQSQYDSAQKYFTQGTLAINQDYTVLIRKPGSKNVKLAVLCALASELKCAKIVWLACRAVDLEKVGGLALGFGAGQANRHVTRVNLNERALEGAIQRLAAAMHEFGQ